jgi:excisionase family DNA binding protein
MLALLQDGGCVTGLLTAREVGEVLGVASETILRWSRAGKLPAIRLPSGAIRYREADIDAWLAAHATSPKRDIPPLRAQNTA